MKLEGNTGNHDTLVGMLLTSMHDQDSRSRWFNLWGVISGFRVEGGMRSYGQGNGWVGEWRGVGCLIVVIFVDCIVVNVKH